MSTGAVCPGCGASLLPIEIAEGQCTRCLRRLPADLVSDAVTGRLPDPRRDGGTARALDDDPRHSDPHEARLAAARGWGGTRVGVALIYWGILLNLVTLALQILMIPALCGGARPVVYLLTLLSAGVTLASGVLCLVGLILYCTIPDQSGGRGWALVGLACLLATISAVVLLGIFAASTPFSRRYLVVPDTLVFLWLVGIVVLVFMTTLAYTLVMRAAARYWGDRELANSFMSFFCVAWVGFVILVIFGVCLGSSVRSSFSYSRELFVVLNCGGLIVGLFMTIWFLGLLSRLRDAIPSGRRWVPEP
jgi:hypothetical protein